MKRRRDRGELGPKGPTTTAARPEGFTAAAPLPRCREGRRPSLTTSSALYFVNEGSNPRPADSNGVAPIQQPFGLLLPPSRPRPGLRAPGEGELHVGARGVSMRIAGSS